MSNFFNIKNKNELIIKLKEEGINIDYENINNPILENEVFLNYTRLYLKLNFLKTKIKNLEIEKEKNRFKTFLIFMLGIILGIGLKILGEFL
nr:hypothetical protein [uncultured Fusobacterium sp.]